MHAILQSALEQLLSRRDLTADQASDCVGVIMDGECDAVEIAAFLTAMTAKGPVANELAGAALAMRSRAAAIVTHRTPLLDTCGTGGDRLHTFNISTTTAIVAAACGVAVAKHGNRSVSSSSGSADVLEALGVNISLTPAAAGKCLDELGLAFCFAPLIHGAMKHAAPVRRQLGFPTIFNLLGPLTNPAGAQFQIVGASSIARAELLAAAVARLPIQRAIVVCGNNELDEVSLWGSTTAFDVREGNVVRLHWMPDQFGLPACDVAALRVQSAAESAGVIQSVLNQERSPARDIVVANTATALFVSNAAASLREGVTLAQMAIDDGRAAAMLERLVAWTNDPANVSVG